MLLKLVSMLALRHMKGAYRNTSHHINTANEYTGGIRCRKVWRDVPPLCLMNVSIKCLHFLQSVKRLVQLHDTYALMQVLKVSWPAAPQYPVQLVSCLLRVSKASQCNQ